MGELRSGGNASPSMGAPPVRPSTLPAAKLGVLVVVLLSGLGGTLSWGETPWKLLRASTVGASGDA
eukprot:5834539-Alexandrium_andersonii.AAC.1